jgi:uncharacterized protein (TIGR00369 family)
MPERVSDVAVGSARRQRVLEWEDPAALAEAFRRDGGLGMLQAIAAGTLPAAPMAALLDLKLAHVEEGRTVLTAMPGEEHQNEVGLVHGGFASALLDNAMGTTLATTMRPGDRGAGLSLSVSFLRPLLPGMGRIRAEGRIVHMGSRIAHLEADLTAESTGEVLVRASGVFSMLREDRSDA